MTTLTDKGIIAKMHEFNLNADDMAFSIAVQTDDVGVNLGHTTRTLISLVILTILSLKGSLLVLVFLYEKVTTKMFFLFF
jgi:hypothetical protein